MTILDDGLCLHDRLEFLNVEINCESFNGVCVQGGSLGAMDSLKVHARYEE